MNYSQKYGYARLGIAMVILLLLAACAHKQTDLGGGVVPVETVQATATAMPTPTATRAPDPTPLGGESGPFQVLASSLVWDASGRWLAYAGSDGRIWLREHASETAQSIEGIGGFQQADLRIAWAPDGEALLVYGEWGLEYPRWTGLWLASIGGAGIEPARPIVAPDRSRSPVEQNSGAITAAAWSPDGKQVAYTFQAEAWVYGLDSGQSRQVTVLTQKPLARADATEPFDGVREVAWAPDGGSLALGLSCNCPSPWSGVGIVDAPAGQASASQETRLLVDGGHSVSWSPDGRWISFQNATGDWTGGSTFDFYGVDPEGGEIANLTLSNPGWDPLFPSEGAYKDAPYQTARLRWGPTGRFLFETLDYLTPSEAAPQWGFAVKDAPEGTAETHPGTLQSWYLFPAWLPDGRTAYLEADATASASNAFAVRRAVVGLEAMSTERMIVHGAAWAPDGSAVALCVSDDSASLPSEVTIVPLSLAPIAEAQATPADKPGPAGILPQPLPPLPDPTGFAIYARDGTGLLLASLVRQATAHIDMPPVSSMLHLAGAVPEDGLDVPVVYYGGEPPQLALQLVSAGETSPLVRVPNLVALVGAPGEPVLAYTALEYQDQGLVSHLYVGTLQSLAGASPVQSVISPESYALAPLAVRAEGGQPTGVWYTHMPYGIGGDIVFPPRSGLYYLDLEAGAGVEILGREMSPSALSLDQGWLAFVSGPVGQLTIRHLATGQETVLPTLPDSDRGAGRAVFSPGNRYVAWMEGHGSMWADPSTFRTTVRVASTAGEPIADLPSSEIPDWALSGIAGSEDMWLMPAGWLDEETLLLQVSFGSPDRSVVLQVHYDGTNLEYLAPGILAGLLYPEQ